MFLYIHAQGVRQESAHLSLDAGRSDDVGVYLPHVQLPIYAGIAESRA